MPKRKGFCDHVEDGDTVKVTTRKGDEWLRLANVNAPERGKRNSVKARQMLEKEVLGKTITFKPVGKSYGRTVAEIEVDGRSVNTRMRRRGYK